MPREPFPHQTHGLGLLRASLQSGHRRPMLSSPTGSGKTVLASMIVAGALRKSNRVTFVVPAVSLINQTYEAFRAEGIDDIGIIQADHPKTDTSKPVQIASVQTLINRPIPPADVVVIDEAHRWFKFYGDWMAMEAWRQVPFVGLSATPWARGLGKHYDDLLIVTTTRELIDKGFLSDFRVFAPSHPDLTGVTTVAGDYHEGQLADRIDQPPLVADAVENWLSHGEKRPTLCFAVNRAHAKHLQESFEARGVRAGYIDAFTSVEAREDIAAAFHRGVLQVVVSVGCLTTGVDWDVRAIVLCRPTKSEMLFTQIIGRGLRTANGKKDCLIFDHSDSHQRLGFVTDIHHDRLHLGAAAPKQEPREKPKLKECPKCHFVEPAKGLGCTACGFKPERQNKIEHLDGELREMGAGRRMLALGVMRSEHQRWYSAFIRIARQHQYQAGWISNSFRDKFGIWPDKLDEWEGVVGSDIENWVKSRNIRFNRRRAS